MVRSINKLIATAAVLMIFSGTSARAQSVSYPEKPVTLVVGYAPGGATDRVARLMAKVLSEQTKQSFYVENKPGANSNIASEQVARSKPDGYTLLVGSIANTINRSLYSKLNYDLIKDFTMVGMLASVPNVLVVNPNVPAKSVAEYIAYAKANPGKLSCASSGSGSSVHLSCELFKMETGTDILHVPYKGSGPAVTDLVGGQVDSMFDNFPASVNQIRSGKLRALGVTNSERLPFAPELPTLAELGLPGFSVNSWFAVMAPAGTPEDVVAKLNAQINQALASKEIKDAYFDAGYIEPEKPNTPASFNAFVLKEIDRWGKVVKQANIKVD